MDVDRRAFSRRQFLTRNAWAVGLALAACAAPPAAEQASKPQAAAQPTSPPAAAPTTAAAAAATPATQAAGASPGTFNVWFSANWNDDHRQGRRRHLRRVGQATKNLKVEWQSIPGSPQQLAKESAALAAGQPPELNNANRTYWYSQGEMADLKELVNKFKDLAGGMYEIGISSNAVADGAIIGAPYAIDVWPAHWRIDPIGAADRRPLLRDLRRADRARPEDPAAAQDVSCTRWPSGTRATT